MTKIDFDIAINIFLKKNSEVKKLYSDIPEALKNNYNFPFRFHFKPKKSKPVLPSISNNNITVEKELMNQAKKGLEVRLKNFILRKNNKKPPRKLKIFIKIDLYMNWIL